MKRVERVVISLLGLIIVMLPIVLRLYIFTEDTEAFDSEFWGCMSLLGWFMGIAMMWSGITGKSLTESEEE